MVVLDFTIDNNDLKALFAACGDSVKRGISWKAWVDEQECAYEEYSGRQTNLKRFRYSYSQWINAQTVHLTSY